MFIKYYKSIVNVVGRNGTLSFGLKGKLYTMNPIPVG